MLSLFFFQLPNSLPGIYEGGGFAFDYSTGFIALRTENYSVQFYSLFDDCGIDEVRSFSVMYQLIFLEFPTLSFLWLFSLLLLQYVVFSVEMSIILHNY